MTVSEGSHTLGEGVHHARPKHHGHQADVVRHPEAHRQRTPRRPLRHRHPGPGPARRQLALTHTGQTAAVTILPPRGEHDGDDGH